MEQRDDLQGLNGDDDGATFAAHRQSVATLEQLLCLTEIQRRKSDAAKRQLELQVDQLLSENALLQNAISQQKDLCAEERSVLEDRYKQLLQERQENEETIEGLERDLAAMNKSLSYYSKVNAAGGDGNTGAIETENGGAPVLDARGADEATVAVGDNDDSKHEIVLRQPLGYMNVDRIHGTAAQRQTQLLAIVEHSAVVFSAIQRKLTALQSIIDAHASEKAAWEQSHCDLTASIAILHREKDILLHEQNRHMVENALVVQILFKDENLHRNLLVAQYEAALFSAAYQRAKADPMIAVKKIQGALDATVSEMNKMKRMHQLELRQAQESSTLDLNRLLEAAKEEHSAAMYENKKQLANFELQNELLRGTCEEWRKQADSRDAAASARYEDLASELHHYRHAKEAELREQLETISRLTDEVAQLTKRQQGLASSRFSEAATQMDGPDYEMELEFLKKRHSEELSALNHATGSKISSLGQENAELHRCCSALQEELTRLELVVVAVECEKKSLSLKHQADFSSIEYEKENLTLRAAAAERQRDFLAVEARQMQQQLSAAQLERDRVLVPSLEKLAKELQTQSANITQLEERHFAAIAQLSEEINKNSSCEALVRELQAKVSDLSSSGASAIAEVRGRLEKAQAMQAEQARENARLAVMHDEELGRKEVLRGYDLYLAQRGSMPSTITPRK
jgi:hypothetical protein